MSETPEGRSSAAPEKVASAAQVPEQARGQQESTSAPEAPPQHRAEAPTEPTGWVGWIIFGAIMMILLGSFQAIAGLTALFKSGYYVVPKNGLLVQVDYTVWGWTHLVLGVVAVVAAFGLLTARMWARVLAIGIAVLSALVNLAFITAYPVWAITMVILDVIVIYAVAMHGKELKAV